MVFQKSEKVSVDSRRASLSQFQQEVSQSLTDFGEPATETRTFFFVTKGDNFAKGCSGLVNSIIRNRGNIEVTWPLFEFESSCSRDSFNEDAPQQPQIGKQPRKSMSN